MKDFYLKIWSICFFLIIINHYESFAQNEKDYPSNVKLIKKNTTKVSESLYASVIEVTNKEYNYFLSDLKQKQEFDKLKKAQIDSILWDIAPYLEPYIRMYHTHVVYNAYPVVNISYAGATLYCEWLTKQYKSNPKQKFNKVVFRLPTEKEWIIAAKAGNPNAIYPWNTDSVKNKKGCYIANFKTTDTTISNTVYSIPKPIIVVPVYSYGPTGFGIYNLSGNAAEMIQEKGVSKGGGFLSLAEDVTVESKGSYNANASGKVDLGFRWFMEIMEE